ncbi:hypothetical protein [Sphingobium sp. B12D2B]|uniref:hypothetical protein n=1 Tax=Sphingobium sp. B12D2B TaxID=2940577 RepID=UPI00222488A5|nr:hypothetical protein [Sphingobium sp. B12D2B]MCW2348941.1 hypothetical protein [Sphingobium sp. B12D2B]
MKRTHFKLPLAGAAALALLMATPALAHKLRPGGVAAQVAASSLTVTPSRDWNQLGRRLGQFAESWTVDGAQLNDVTFYAAVPAGQPLIKERSKKREPLPKFTSETLLIEIPELLERTYRTAKDLAAFELISTEPSAFVGAEGVRFRYAFTDKDGLTRQGEARAAIIAGKLYMMTYDAPRLNYFSRNAPDFEALVASARLN